MAAGKALLVRARHEEEDTLHRTCLGAEADAVMTSRAWCILFGLDYDVYEHVSAAILEYFRQISIHNARG